MGTLGKARKQQRFISLRKIAALFPLGTQLSIAEASQLPEDLSYRLNPNIDPHELFILWHSTQSSEALEQDKLNVTSEVLGQDKLNVTSDARDIVKPAAAQSAVDTDSIYGCLPLSKLNHDLCFSSTLLEHYPFFQYLKLALCCQLPLPPSLLGLQHSSNFADGARIEEAATIHHADSYQSDFAASILSFLQEHAFWRLSLAFAPQYIFKMLKQSGIDPRLITSTESVDADICSLSMAFYLPQSQFMPEVHMEHKEENVSYASQSSSLLHTDLNDQSDTNYHLAELSISDSNFLVEPSHSAPNYLVNLSSSESHDSAVDSQNNSSSPTKTHNTLYSATQIDSLAVHSGLAEQQSSVQTSSAVAPQFLEASSNASLAPACSNVSLEQAISKSSLDPTFSKYVLDSAYAINTSPRYGQGAWLLESMQRVLMQGKFPRGQIVPAVESFEQAKRQSYKGLGDSRNFIKDGTTSAIAGGGESWALGAGASSWQGSSNIQQLAPSLMIEAEKYMAVALELAQQAADMGEVPVGAVLVDETGNIVARGFNRTIMDSDITAHAEMVAFRRAGQVLSNHRLNQLTLYVTLEPCCMCAMAAIHARIKRIIFGAAEYKTGACGSQFNLALDPRHNHRLEIYGGVMQQQCRELLQDFFMLRRQQSELD